MKKINRIRKNEEFQTIISKKQSIANASFVLYFAPREEDHARVGLSVSKKLGDAVTRNRIKRQIRMMFIEGFDYDTYPFDVIAIAKSKYLEFDYATNKKSLEKLLNKVLNTNKIIVSTKK